MSNDCRIDADLLFLAIEKHDLGNSRILDLILPELIRKRQQLVRFAEYRLGKSFVDSLGIPPDAVLDQWAVFKIQEACQNNNTPVPEKMRHSTEGLMKDQQSVVWNSIFGFSRSCNPSLMEHLWSAGFRVRTDLPPWTLGFNWGPGKNTLDQVDWFIRHGYDVHSQFVHDATSFMAYSNRGDGDDPFGFDVKTDIHSTKKRAETLEKIYFSSYSMDHHCPCSTEGCIAATASLVRTSMYCKSIFFFGPCLPWNQRFSSPQKQLTAGSSRLSLLHREAKGDRVASFFAGYRTPVDGRVNLAGIVEAGRNALFGRRKGGLTWPQNW